MITVFSMYAKITGKRYMLCTEGPLKQFAFSFNTRSDQVEAQGPTLSTKGPIVRFDPAIGSHLETKAKP